ncbi:hypothetical protein HG66A1_52950 [Gimesia chilikensis]|uniref:Uncharacterized protein n=1 Tax=Gimesia chilikensis TaxID=2605989 RepID=A0A517PVT2_9PLAN|nr:hypothetical protein HG66A1_52950 [Gimesia chilikensis]
MHGMPEKLIKLSTFGSHSVRSIRLILIPTLYSTNLRK